MKCPHCQSWSLIKETRGTRRRRECANGHRFTSVEVTVDEGRDRAAAKKLGNARAKLRALGYLQ